MFCVEHEYLPMVGCRLEKFVRKKDDLYTFRCPYCGDSSKNKNKTRGYFYSKKNELLFKCHNCGVGRTFANFLKDNFPDLYDQYLMDRYSRGLTGKGTNTPNPKFDFKTPVFKLKPKGLQTISSLEEDHPAKKYLRERKLPEERLSELYYVDKYKSWVNSQVPTFEDTSLDHPRIILPLINNGEWFGFQGRSLNPRDKMRYITTILDRAQPKIFGLDKADFGDTVYITEGPIDSLFLSNSIAMVGADIDWLFLITNMETEFVFIYDNEPRNKQIVERMEKVIDSNFPIVIWPSDVTQKDINDMVLAGHEVQTMVESNTYSGLEAKLKLLSWKKV
jgi:transcription elongation factor Elf1